MKEFFKRKNIEISLNRYGVDVLAYMAQGLFSSLIVGLIIKVTGDKLGIPCLTSIGELAMSLMGPAIGVAVAWGLKAPLLVIFASVITGAAGAANGGGPAGALIASLIGAEIGKMVSKETKIDIVVTPATTVITGVAVGMFLGPSIGGLMVYLGTLIMRATEFAPITMGITVSVLMGMILTLPISSAALAIMLGLEGAAAGAATVGCACQMVGFAVASYRDNGWGGLISQGLGTSMLQMPNIVKNPLIWIPPIFASGVLGPVATTILPMNNIAIGAGMGTSGLVGQFATIEAMGLSNTVILKIGLMHFLLPALLTLLAAGVLKKMDWIKPGDMKI
ncbi:MAG: PTS sugar transporter subunit IIC [Bacillota bacterium]